MCEKSKILGQIIRTKRKSRKMSVRALSELTGIHSGAIIKLELGKTDMTISSISFAFKSNKKLLSFISNNHPLVHCTKNNRYYFKFSNVNF